MKCAEIYWQGRTPQKYHETAGAISLFLPLPFTFFLSPPAALSDYVRNTLSDSHYFTLSLHWFFLTFQSGAVFLSLSHLALFLTPPRPPALSLHRGKMCSWWFGHSPGSCWLYYHGSSLSPWKMSIIAMTSVLLLGPCPVGLCADINTLLLLERILQGHPSFSFLWSTSSCKGSLFTYVFDLVVSNALMKVLSWSLSPVID